MWLRRVLRVRNTVSKLTDFNDYAAARYAAMQPKLAEKVRNAQHLNGKYFLDRCDVVLRITKKSCFDCPGKAVDHHEAGPG